MSKKKADKPTMTEATWIRFQLSAIDTQVTNLFGEFRDLRQSLANLETRLRAVEAGLPVTVTAASTPSATVEFKPATPKFDPKLPWKSRGCGTVTGIERAAPVDSEGALIAALLDDGHKETSDLIVRAVNAHADAKLVAQHVIDLHEIGYTKNSAMIDAARRILEGEK